MYNPDPRIVRYLREYDPDLGARWDIMHGRWWVTWRGKDAWIVQEQGGAYRPLDERVLTQAKLQDTWRHRDTATMMRLHEEENHRLRGLRQQQDRDERRYWFKHEAFPRVSGVGGVNGRNAFAGWTPGA